jgi:hypothetical protein
MDDLSGLASTLAAGVGDVRGCLILSRDGLVVGSHLPDGEGSVKPAWIRFAAVGEPERGFVQFGTETWCYVRRGPYAAFVVVRPAARPGLVIDHMDQLLLSAEESRMNRVGSRADPPPAAPSSKPRTVLHPDQRPAGPPDPAEGAPDEPPGGASPEEGPPPAPPGASLDEPSELDEGLWDLSGDDGDVDRFSLAREFGQLLQDAEDGADG